MPDFDEFEHLRQCYYVIYPPELAYQTITKYISIILDYIREDHQIILSNPQSNYAKLSYERNVQNYRLIAVALGLENRAAAKTLYDSLRATIYPES